MLTLASLIGSFFYLQLSQWLRDANERQYRQRRFGGYRKPQQIRRGWDALGWNRTSLAGHPGCDEVLPHDQFLVASAGEAEIKSLGSGGLLRCGGLGLCFDALQGADDLDTGGGTPMRRAAGAQQTGKVLRAGERKAEAVIDAASLRLLIDEDFLVQPRQPV